MHIRSKIPLLACVLFFSVAPLFYIFIPPSDPVFVDGKPVELYFGFESYKEKDEVMLLLKNSGYKIDIVEDSSLPIEDKRPALSTYKVDVYDYKNSDFQGKIRLHFLNNKLYNLLVYTPYPELFPGSNGSSMKNIPKPGGCIDQRKHIEVCNYEIFISFSDKRIMKYVFDWMSKWS